MKARKKKKYVVVYEVEIEARNIKRAEEIAPIFGRQRTMPG